MKNFAIIVLMIGCGYLAYLYFFNPKVETVTNNDISPAAQAYVKAEVTDVNNKITKKGFKVAVIEAVANTVGDIDLVRDSLKSFKDSATKAIGIKDKQIISLTQYNAHLEDSLLKAINVGDTSFKYANNGLKLEFNKPTNKDPYFNYSYDAKINYMEYWKKKHFLASKKNYIDFWIEDNRASINGVKRLRVEPKPDHIKVDVNASSIYTDRLNIGLDADVTIGRYKLGAGYYYDMDRKTWQPVLKAKFKLLEF